MVNYWGVFLGEGGKYVQKGYDGKFIAIGWTELGSLEWLHHEKDDDKAWETLKKKYEDIYSQKNSQKLSPVKIGIEAGEVYRFVKEIAKDDIVLVPNPIERKVLIGKVIGDYEYKEEWGDGCPYRNRRKVEWIKEISRDELPKGVKNSLVWLTIMSLQKHSADLDAVLAGTKVEKKAAKGDITGYDLKNEIKKRLMDMEPREFEEFIAHLLEVMGFETSNRKYVGDDGIDVDGFLNAKLAIIMLRVQVKRISSALSNDKVLQLRGTLGSDDLGAIITTSRFTKSALEEAQAKEKKRIALIDGDSLVDLILENYDELDTKYRNMLELKRKAVPLIDQFYIGQSHEEKQ